VRDAESPDRLWSISQAMVKLRTEVTTSFGVIVIEEMDDGTVRVNGDPVQPAGETLAEMAAADNQPPKPDVAYKIDRPPTERNSS
jgi:hypothetical protein